MGRWVTGCARDGFDAVEFDNLDSFTRSHGLMTRDGVGYAELLVRRAHDAGLAVGQKNLAGYDGTAIGFDFAVAEECGRYRRVRAYDEALRRPGARDRVPRARTSAGPARTYGDRLAVVLPRPGPQPDGVRQWC